jgi:hypothetical protein
MSDTVRRMSAHRLAAHPRPKRRTLATPVLIAALCWVSIASPSTAQAQYPDEYPPGYPPGQDPVNATFNSLSSAAAAKVGRDYGCVAAQQGRSYVVLLITSKHGVKPARRLVSKLHPPAPVKIRVIDPRNSEAALEALNQKLVNYVGFRNPDVLTELQTDRSGHRTCGTLRVTMSSAAPAWVTQTVNDFQHDNSPERLTVTVLPPEQMPVIGRVEPA